jgi:predicted aspartyl protease
MAWLGHLPAEQVYTFTTQARIDTGATRSILPPFVAEPLGLIRLSRTEAHYANGFLEEGDVTEPFLVEILDRLTSDDAMVLGEDVLLGVTILEKLDLLVDGARQRVIPNPAHPDQPVLRVSRFDSPHLRSFERNSIHTTGLPKLCPNNLPLYTLDCPPFLR